MIENPTGEVRYLDVPGAIAVNNNFSGGGVLNLNSLQSAIGQPQQGAFGVDLYPTLDDKAAVLFRGLAQNHAFVDGNKRTAVTSTDIFLRANGFGLDVESRDLVKFTLAVAQAQMSVEEMSAHIQSWRVPVRGADRCVVQALVQSRGL